MEKISRLAAGVIRVNCDVKDNIIVYLEINGDFVVRGELNQLCSSLVGCEYSKEKVNEILASHQSDNIIYGVSGEELLQVIFS